MPILQIEQMDATKAKWKVNGMVILMYEHACTTFIRNFNVLCHFPEIDGIFHI